MAGLGARLAFNAGLINRALLSQTVLDLGCDPPALRGRGFGAGATWAMFCVLLGDD